MSTATFIAIAIIVGLLLVTQPIEALHGLGSVLFFFGSVSAWGFITQSADD
jgi:hypothetical protein